MSVQLVQEVRQGETAISTLGVTNKQTQGKGVLQSPVKDSWVKLLT